jgi:hypothetical protein
VFALPDSFEDGLSIASAMTDARQKTRRRHSQTAALHPDHRDDGLAS